MKMFTDENNNIIINGKKYGMIGHSEKDGILILSLVCSEVINNECEWKLITYGGIYQPQCNKGYLKSIDDDYIYCPYCGKRIRR